MQQCTDQEFKSCYQQYANQHRENYESLLKF